MMRRVSRWAVLAVPLVAAACGRSPKTQVLTLDAVAPPAAAVRAGYRGPPLVVPAVHVPAAIDRTEYVSEPGAGEVRIDDFAHWAAPLGLLARDTLVRDLAARLPAGAVLPPGATAGTTGARVLDVTILLLDLRPGGATLQVAYRTLPAGPVRQATLTAPGGGTPVADAQALSALIGQLADQIAGEMG